MSNKHYSVQTKADEILSRPCPYTVPPLIYINGHAICPCIANAIKGAYVDGWNDGTKMIAPQLGAMHNGELYGND